MRLHHSEPQFGGAEVVRIDDLLSQLLAPTLTPSGPCLLAIDGRSSNGKSLLASRLATQWPGAAIVHTDDVAWWHSRFGWEGLILDGIIRPIRRGADVSYRPPAWHLRDRPGAITVPGDAPLVIIEGVGSGRRSLHEELDAILWVQTDLDVADARNAVRVAAGEIDQAGYEGWMAEEIPFQEAERTWERADVIVSGSPPPSHDSETEVVVLR